jgi:glutamine synthetase
MTEGRVRQGIEWLRDAAAAGEVHTVRVSFADRLGVWRGKRVPVQLFLEDAGRPLGFCDGMLVVDVHADLVQETRYSNYETGYPDVYVHPDLAGIRPVGWTPGEAYVFGPLRDEHGAPSDVAPLTVLARVAERASRVHRLEQVTLSVSGRLMESPDRACDLGLGVILSEPDRVLTRVADGLEASGITVDVIEVDAEGRFRMRFAPLDPAAAGEAGIIAKSALKEVARAAGIEAIFMTRTAPGASPSTWTIEVPIGDATLVSPGRVASLAEDARGLLAPSIAAQRAGPLLTSVDSRGSRTVVRVDASAEASPQTAVACAIAIAFEAAAGRDGLGPVANLADAAARLEAAGWLSDWLGEELPINSAPLLRAEQDLFDAAVTDWELQRYWKAS